MTLLILVVNSNPAATLWIFLYFFGETNLFSFLKNSKNDHIAEKLYRLLIFNSRRESFYVDYGVHDTIDGRFDTLLLLSYLLFNRLSLKPNQTKHVSQAIFDLMFADMDKNIENHKKKGPFYLKNHLIFQKTGFFFGFSIKFNN